MAKTYPHVQTIIPNSQWKGTVSERMYYAPRESAESVENQELIFDRQLRAQREREQGADFESVLGPGNTVEEKRVLDYMKKAAGNAILENAANLAAPATKVILDGWLERHPNFVDSDYNGQQIGLLLKRKYGVAAVYDEADLDEALSDAARMGILQVVPDMAKQKKMSADEIYVAAQIALQSGRKPEPEPEPEPFDEAAAEQMTLSELRRRSSSHDPLGPQY
jgi:hypothetical protein